MELKFFVESKKSDKKFLQDFIEERFGEQIPDENFIELGSWSGYKNEINNYYINSDQGIQNITIIDTDLNFEQRKLEITQDFTKLNIHSDLFLIPNNSSSGCLETLLVEITVDKKIIDCFTNYENCIQDYNKPILKSKIFAYLDALLEEKYKKGNRKDLIQELNRDYRNKLHWNLYHQSLDYLYTFLEKYFVL